MSRRTIRALWLAASIAVFAVFIAHDMHELLAIASRAVLP